MIGHEADLPSTPNENLKIENLKTALGQNLSILQMVQPNNTAYMAKWRLKNADKYRELIRKHAKAHYLVLKNRKWNPGWKVISKIFLKILL